MIAKYNFSLVVLLLTLSTPAWAQTPAVPPPSAPALSPSPTAIPSTTGGIGLQKGQPIKIMPMGDSITEGKFTTGGYRKPLYKLLKDDGFDVSFVGKEDNGEVANATGFSTGMESPNHEGYGSARVGMLLKGGTVEKHTALPIQTTLANNNPDVVLIMLGTNDMFGGATADQIAATLQQLVDAIYKQNSAITVVLASIPPMLKVPAKVDAYNALIPGIVDKEKALNHKIAFADIHSVFGPTDMSKDKVHPNQAGYDKMAALWYSVLTGDSAPTH